MIAQELGLHTDTLVFEVVDHLLTRFEEQVFQNLGVVGRLPSLKFVRVRPFHLRDQSLLFRSQVLSFELWSKVGLLEHTFGLVDIVDELAHSVQ